MERPVHRPSNREDHRQDLSAVLTADKGALRGDKGSRQAAGGRCRCSSDSWWRVATRSSRLTSRRTLVGGSRRTGSPPETPVPRAPQIMSPVQPHYGAGIPLVPFLTHHASRWSHPTPPPSVLPVPSPPLRSSMLVISCSCENRCWGSRPGLNGRHAARPAADPIAVVVRNGCPSPVSVRFRSGRCLDPSG